MTIFTGGKSTAINSPRHLTLRHARRVIGLRKRALGFRVADEDKVILEPPLKPGQEKLNSFWAPGLKAGPTHHVKVKQVIDAGTGEKLELTAEQDFLVDAPQFSLPEGSIHSVYPPPGYSDDHRILPHVVLTDPHLPWERLGSPKTGADGAAARNKVPWLALLSFTQDELRLAPEVLGDKGIFQGTTGQLAKPVKQTSTMAVNMTVEDVWATTDITTPVTTGLGPEAIKKERGDFIFVKPELFTSLFSPFDSSNTRQMPSFPDTLPYQFLSHVRKINTTGMAVAGVEDIGIFSVVVGNRSGPLDNPTATSVSVHLASIEGVEAMRFPITTSYVALCSLHSWNYTVTPPGMLNVSDAFDSLGETLGVLRPPDALIDSVRSSGGDIPERLARRLEDGYSLVKYRTQTGEPTVALFRGPFTPTVVPPLEMNDCSNSGLDLQILDKEVGIMDITYSSAWQLGRMLALGDQAFTAALARLRSAIHARAMKASKIAVVNETSPGSLRTREVLLDGLKSTVKDLAQVCIAMQPDGGFRAQAAQPDGSPPPPPRFEPGGPYKRWHRRRLHGRKEFPRLSFREPAIEDQYLIQAIQAAGDLAKSTDGTVYDEQNAPVSTDWMIVLAWVMNRMFLAGVPAHYLITDPSHLEHESLRFFHIDPNWVDAMVDGALSLANHMGDDKDRVAIKTALNNYIESTPEYLPHAPQIPTYGFFLRSDLVTMFPDLKVTTLPAQPDPPKRAPLLRHKIVTDGVMLGLLDRTPGSNQFTGLVFTQPPHQQRFAVARRLGADGILVDIRRQYTVDQEVRMRDNERHRALRIDGLPTKPSDQDNLFIWGSQPGLTDLHILRLPRFADVQLRALVDHMGSNTNGSEEVKYFVDDAATSALFALQLNDPTYNLTISLATPPALTALASLAPPPDGGAEADAPRTLKRLKHSRVKRLTATHDTPSDDEGPPEEPDDDDARVAADATFERHASYKPAPHVLAHLAPHVRAIPTEAPPPPVPAAATDELSVKSPASAPKYDCRIYTPPSESVHTGDHLPRDLIFSVLVSNNQHSSYRLVEFDIRIRLGPADHPTRRTLMAGYDGPGPSMLSNLRFNVLASFPTINNVAHLLLRLLPRSSKAWIDIARVNEMGFLLCLARVNEFAQRQTLVYVETLAYYKDDSHSPRDDRFLVEIINEKFSAVGA